MKKNHAEVAQGVVRIKETVRQKGVTAEHVEVYHFQRPDHGIPAKEFSGLLEGRCSPQNTLWQTAPARHGSTTKSLS
jgi:hypothetical protein